MSGEGGGSPLLAMVLSPALRTLDAVLLARSAGYVCWKRAAPGAALRCERTPSHARECPATCSRLRLVLRLLAVLRRVGTGARRALELALLMASYMVAVGCAPAYASPITSPVLPPPRLPSASSISVSCVSGDARAGVVEGCSSPPRLMSAESVCPCSALVPERLDSSSSTMSLSRLSRMEQLPLWFAVSRHSRRSWHGGSARSSFCIILHRATVSRSRDKSACASTPDRESVPWPPSCDRSRSSSMLGWAGRGAR